MFDLDKIHQVTSCVITWTCFINVTHGVSDIAGWTLQLIIDFGLVQAFEAKRVQAWKKTSVLLSFVELVITYVTLKEHMKELF